MDNKNIPIVSTLVFRPAPAPPPPPPPIELKGDIRIPPRAKASDETLVEDLKRLITSVLFHQGSDNYKVEPEWTTSQIKAYLRARQQPIAFARPNDKNKSRIPRPREKTVACIRIKRASRRWVSSARWSWTWRTTGPTSKRNLLRYLEKRRRRYLGLSTMRSHFVAPASCSHAVKMGMEA
ncbi:hypothetical protein F4680DRAFT_465060 [Xylaria scruposa]|nr:hypothetical protein F4680DRAFT_465060 [Xylaria scruposa]